MTGGRLARLAPGDLDAAQRALHESISGGPRAAGPRLFQLVDGDGRLEGPFNAMLYSPAIGHALQSLGAALRYSGRLPDRSREIAILVVGHARSSEFEVYAHEAVARAVGLTDAELECLREDRPDDLPDAAERVLALTARALARRGDLDDGEYGAARDELGEPALFELTTLVGYYQTLALQLRVFAVPLPVGVEPG